MKLVVLVVLLAAVVTAGLRWGSFVAGGSDSYCYLHQAQGWASGRLQVPEPMALDAPWPDAPLTFAPSGHRPSPTVPGAIVPVCPPGLSMAMALFVAVAGIDAAFLVVPLFGALLIGATYVVAARFGRHIGLASACVAACSPVFLYQLMQPMSDVPAAALWVAAVAFVTGTSRRGAALGGAAAGAAILIRPNLFPLAVPLAAYILWRQEHSWRNRLRSVAAFASGVASGCLLVLLIQRTFHGSPFASGYGSLDTLFDTAHISPNAGRYFAWLWQSHTPVWLVAAAAPFLLPGALTRLLLALILVNAACYLPYVVFDDWSYLRFFLPTIPLLLILTIATIDSVFRRIATRALPAPGRRARPERRRRIALKAVIVTAVVLAALFVREANERNVFRLQALEARYERAGTYVARRLPQNAVVITSWQSGSVRFYSGRPTLVWDVLDPAWLDRGVQYLRARGLEPFLLFESWEEPLFRKRFVASRLGALDWPPAVEVASQVRIYRPDDRERYLAGTQAPTDYAR